MCEWLPITPSLHHSIAGIADLPIAGGRFPLARMKRISARGLYSPELLESRIAPATIIVTSLVDDGSDTIAEMTLREAIDAANLAPGTDTITFDPALIPVNPPFPPVVTTLHATIVLTSQIEIKDTLIIKGPGVDKLAISGDDSDRIFEIDDLDPLVLHPTTISGISFEHGSATTSGGAIRSTETLILKNTTFSNNYADASGGGAIHVSTKGKVSITNTAFLNNTANTGSGGALYARAEGGISIVKSLVSGNSAASNGGGFYLFVPVPAPIPGVVAKPAHIVIDGVTFLGNSAQSGGGLWADNASVKGKITVKNSTFTGNSAVADATATGGGLYLNAGIASVTGSTFSNNSVLGTVTPADARGGGLAANFGTSLTIKSSRFEGNISSGMGGGISLDNEVLVSIAGVVFSGNKTSTDGGAIAARNTTFTIASSLLAGNAALDDGGGIFLDDSALTLKGSTVSGNAAGGA